MNKNPEEYINSSLNNSISKFVHSFAKADRFQRPHRVHTQAKYTLPSTISKRTCSFGHGNKITIINQRCSPPPNAYKSITDFDKDQVKLKSPVFGYGRTKVNFGSYIYEAEKKGKKLPSPNKYYFNTPKNTISGHIGVRLKTESEYKRNKDTPGPGTYNPISIQMANSSSFFLSNFKRSTSPKLHASSMVQLQGKRKINHSSLFYNVDEKQFGKSRSSKFRNVASTCFGRQKRDGIIEKSKLNTPGFKYTIFSEFGN